MRHSLPSLSVLYYEKTLQAFSAAELSSRKQVWRLCNAVTLRNAAIHTAVWRAYLWDFNVDSSLEFRQSWFIDEKESSSIPTVSSSTVVIYKGPWYINNDNEIPVAMYSTMFLIFSLVNSLKETCVEIRTSSEVVESHVSITSEFHTPYLLYRKLGSQVIPTWLT